MQTMLQLAAELAARARSPSYIDPDAAQTWFLEKMEHENFFLDHSKGRHFLSISVPAPKGIFH